MPPLSPELIAAYRDTTYWVDAPQQALPLRIGARHPEFDQLLREQRVSRWAFLSAWNPHSEILPAADNQAAHTQLLATVHALGYAAWPGRGVGADPGWTPEESLCVLDLPREAARQLGRQFQQHAAVVGEVGGTAELLLINEAPNATCPPDRSAGTR